MTSTRYSLERHLSIQDYRDAPPLSTPTPVAPLRYATINSGQYRRPPQRFYIKADSEHQNPHGQISCYPGSIIHGKVVVELTDPLMCLHIKLIFKGEEKIATHSKSQHRLVDGRLFAVRTLLWGLPQMDESSRDTLPLLEPGKAQWNFLIQMPLINYPPSFQNPYVSCSYTLLSVIERPGARPFQTQHMTVDFRPIIPTPSPIRDLNLSSTPPTHQKILLPTHDIHVTLSKHSFSLPQATYIPIRWLITESTNHKMKKGATPTVILRAKLQRSIKVTHTTIYQEDYTTISRAERSWQPPPQGPSTIDMRLPLVFSGEDFGPSSSSSSPRTTATTMALHPTMEYSRKFRIQYRVILSVKMRHGTKLSGTKKKQTVSIPIHIATLCQGTKPPAALVPFTHQDVLDDETMHTKPKFLPPPPCHVDDLPPYDPKDNPPTYLLV